MDKPGRIAHSLRILIAMEQGMTLKPPVWLAFVLSAGTAFAAPAPAAQTEINHLMDYLAKSGCEFNRNGSWYGSKEARDHLNDKYQYLLKKDWVSNTESFIERAATQSSISGKAYQVRCGAAQPVASAAWLKAELSRYRQRK